MKKLLLASTFLAFAVSAHAADMSSTPSMMSSQPVYDWSGFYAGIQAGYGWGDHDRQVLPAGFANSYDSDGFLGGAYLGYNWQYGSVVAGAETDWNISGVDGNDAGAGGTTDTTDLQWFGSVRARVGYAFDRALIFGTGGLAVSDFEHTNNFGAGQTTSHTETGWTIGGGVEYAVTQTVTVRSEYRYYDFGDYSVSAPTNGVAPYSVDNTMHTVTVGIGMKF